LYSQVFLKPLRHSINQRRRHTVEDPKWETT
jgi:hypothetical protein